MMGHGLKLMLMERDGTTPCFVRLAVIAGQGVYFGLTAVALHKGTPFDPIAWATGYTALIMAGAGGALLKLKTENPEKDGP